MPNYKIQDAMILYSIDKLDGGMPVPPNRLCPLTFEQELSETMALIGRFSQLCADLKAMATPITALDLNDAREQLKVMFTQMLVLEGAQMVALDGGSIPTYRPLPNGGHWTEDYLQFIDGAGNRTPWFMDVPQPAATHRAFPCLRVFLKIVP